MTVGLASNKWERLTRWQDDLKTPKTFGRNDKHHKEGILVGANLAET